MPTYVAFLRAINLGAKRKFPKADLLAATEAAGSEDVEAYLNTGNVLLTSRRRSAAAVARDLEQAYAADRGFEVPTIVFRTAEVRAIAETADELVVELGEPAQLNVTLYADPPPAAAARAVEGLELADRAVVRDRAAYVFLHDGFHNAKLLGTREFRALGTGTARNVTVLREIARRWCR